MKNVFKLSGIIALAAIIGFTVIACGNGTTPGGGDITPTSVTYTSTDGTNDYKLEIIKNSAAKAAYNPQNGDSYKLSVTGNVNNTSSGTVNIVNGGFELNPGGDKSKSFTVTVNTGGEMTEITGTITFDDKATKSAPGAVTPKDSAGNVIVSGVTVTYAPDITDIDDAKKATDFGYSYTFDGFKHISDFLDGTSSVKINNGKLTISLGVPKPAYMDNLPDTDAKGVVLDCFLTSDKKYAVWCEKDDNNGAFLTYVDKDVTFTDSNSDYVYDCSFKKGWNYVIWSDDKSSGIITTTSSTTLPSGYNWVVSEYRAASNANNPEQP